MTSRQYDDYCRVTKLLNNMRKSDLLVLEYCLNGGIQEEKNQYYIERIRFILEEVRTQMSTCVVD
jgi:hypothetical protein